MSMTKKQKARLKYRLITCALAVILVLAVAGAVYLIRDADTYKTKTAEVIQKKNDAAQLVSEYGSLDSIKQSVADAQTKLDAKNLSLSNLTAAMTEKQSALDKLNESLQTAQTVKQTYVSSFNISEYSDLEYAYTKLYNQINAPKDEDNNSDENNNDTTENNGDDNENAE